MSKKKNNAVDCTMESILHNYMQTEQSIVSQLHYQVPNHGLTIGGFREEIWKQLFEQIVPKKYSIEQSVFIMDSEGNVSAEVDLAIFDEMYTPYIFRNGRIKFIPIEAVAAVVQCKSKGYNHQALCKWCASIKKLKTSRNAIARMVSGMVTQNTTTSIQKATRPILVLCHLHLNQSKRVKLKHSNSGFDFVLTADNAKQRIQISINQDSRCLREWFTRLNRHNFSEDSSNNFSLQDEGNTEESSYRTNYRLDEYSIKANDNRPDVSLLSFNLQFNQLLMLINNPMLFPHKAYAEMFQKVYANMKPTERKGRDGL